MTLWDYLQKHAFTLTVHGNGFIILDFASSRMPTRLHFWGHPDIPSQNVDTSIHDHNFQFTSVVLLGGIINTHYSSVDVEAYEKLPFLMQSGYLENSYRVYCPMHTPNSPDTKLNYSYEDVRIKPQPDEYTRQYARYDMPSKVLHSTEILGPTITAMCKTSRDSAYRVKVLCPYGQTPDNSFDRTVFDKDLCLGIVEELSREAHPPKSIGLSYSEAYFDNVCKM